MTAKKIRDFCVVVLSGYKNESVTGGPLPSRALSHEEEKLSNENAREKGRGPRSSGNTCYCVHQGEEKEEKAEK